MHSKGFSKDLLCCCCGENETIFIHMFWSCTVIQSFWSEIISSIKRGTGQALECTDICILLNYHLYGDRLMVSIGGSYVP